MAERAASSAADELKIVRAELEVVRALKRHLASVDPDLGCNLKLRGGGTPVRVEGILLDINDSQIDDVVILFRDLSRPEHLFRMRMEATDPDMNPPDAEIWAGVIWANLEEAIVGGPGFSGRTGFGEGDATRIVDV